MAELEEGFQYGLSANSISFSKKSIVHVKLTDTSLKVIEDYLKRKNAPRNQSVIQFNGTQGTIQVPDSGNELRTFQFSMSAIQGDPNGSFDAVCQTGTKTGNQLTLEGSMCNKLQVHATDELFQATRERVTQAELDSKKNTTKVIKQSGPHISRKKTTVIRNSQPLPQPRQVPIAKPKPSSQPPVNFMKRPSPSYGSQGHAVSPHNPTSTSSKPTSPSLAVAHSTNTSCNIPKSTGNPAVMTMPYRDRVIHLLAIRPFKKPELIIRLRKDGIREKDKDMLGTILKQIAVSKDNNFTLAKHVFTTEVRQDWPFYTDEDRQILKKKLQSASSVSPSASPANRSPDSQSAVTEQKRSESHKRPSDDSHSQQNSKKKRISLYDKTTSNSESNHTSSTDRRSNVSMTADSSDKKENINATVDSTSDIPAYMTKYFSISDDTQRQKYKHDFNTEYAEYRELHTVIEKVSKKFYELQVLRKKTPKDTIEYEDLEHRIRKEYIQQKSDPKYIDQKRRFEYLHGKLAYIKRLICDYDQKHVISAL